MSQSWRLYDTQNKYCSHLVNFFLNKLRILLYKPSTFVPHLNKNISITLSNSLSAFFLSTTYTFVMYSSNPSAPQKYADAPPPGQAPAMGVPVNTYQPQAAPFQVQSSAPVPWSTGLCDCSDDVGNCCITCCCPCITFGQIAEIVDRGATSCAASGGLYTLINLLTGCGFLYSCFYRSKMRRQYKLEESCCGDCMVHCCCEPCALCQEYRELKHQGFDLSIGWQGNVDQRTQGVMTATAPVSQGGMNR